MASRITDRADLTAGLNEAQARAVLSTASPVRIIAGAGSGKTRVLTRRIARRVHDDDADASHVLAVTFTRKAAAELRSRLGSLGLRDGVTAGTFHAIASAQLRQRWEERRITPPELLSRKVAFVARLMSGRSSSAPYDVVTEIEWAKARMISAPDYPAAAERAGRRGPLDPTQVARLYERYEEAKRDKRMIDFDDLLRLATRDIVADPEFAAARRWRFRHLFVDEFQDVNPLQFTLLRAWLGDSVDLCVVGDANQAIYAWNGADASYLEDFDDHFPGGETVLLDENYRSTPQILGVANAVLSLGPGQPLRLRATRADGPLPTITRAADEVAEARLIARRLRDNHPPGRAWSEQAVLVRTNAQLPVVEEALRDARIPYRSRGGGRLLDQPEVRDALRSLGATRGSFPNALVDLEATINQSAPDDDTSPALSSETDSRSTGVAASDLTDERTANLAELVRLGAEYRTLDPNGTVAGFSAWLTATLRNDDGPGRDAVDLATFHAAKGLEWAVVHLAGMEEGLVPISHARTTDALDEERRLLYVALTRAQDQLHLTYAGRRAFGTRSQKRAPSPDLEIIEAARGMLKGTGSPDMLTKLREQRTALRGRDGSGRRSRRGASTPGDIDAADRPLADALRSWRLEQSRAADVPAFVIFTDATLASIVTLRPADQSTVLAVTGIGAVKAQRFGAEIIRIVGAHPRQG